MIVWWFVLLGEKVVVVFAADVLQKSLLTFPCCLGSKYKSVCHAATGCQKSNCCDTSATISSFSLFNNPPCDNIKNLKYGQEVHNYNLKQFILRSCVYQLYAAWEATNANSNCLTLLLEIIRCVVWLAHIFILASQCSMGGQKWTSHSCVSCTLCVSRVWWLSCVSCRYIYVRITNNGFLHF